MARPSYLLSVVPAIVREKNEPYSGYVKWLSVVLLVMLAAAKPCSAQQTAPASGQIQPAVLSIPPYTHADTVRALHNLFKSKRSTGGWLAGGSAVSTAIVGIGTLVDDNGQGCGGYFCPDATAAAVMIGVGTAPAWVPAIFTLVRFSQKRERAAVAAYEQTRKLPHILEKRMAPRFFNANYRFSKRQ